MRKSIRDRRNRREEELHAVEVATPAEAAEQALPEQIQVSLAEIAGAAKEGLLALATGTGLAVLHEAMEHEVEQVAGSGAATTPSARPTATAAPRVR